MKRETIEDYLEELRHLLTARPEDERQNLLTQVRDHLEADAAKRRGQDPLLTQADAERAAVDAFGSPSEVAGVPAPTPIARRTFPSPKARRWLLVGGTAILLAGAAGLAVTLLTYESSVYPDPYARWDNFANATHNVTDTFEIHADYTRAEFHLIVEDDRADGCVAVTLTSPRGDTVFDEDNICLGTQRTLAIDEVGTWQIRVAFTDFTGRFGIIVPAWEGI